MKEFLDVILGTTPLGNLLAYQLLSLIGATFYLLVQTNRRTETDNGNPIPWSWSFFWKDNAKRLATTFILVFLWARFGDQLSSFVPPEYKSLGALSYVAIGFGTDALVAMVHKKWKRRKK